MKILSTIFMTTGLALGTITLIDVPASADIYSGYSSFGTFGGYYGVPGGYPDLSWLFRPHSIHPRPYYAASPYAYRTGGSAGGGHVQRCLARYQTYDPATDLYFRHPGVQARCRL